MTSRSSETKRKILKERLEALLEEYAAVSAQLNRVLEERSRIRLNREKIKIEQEIEAVETDLRSLLPNLHPDTHIKKPDIAPFKGLHPFDTNDAHLFFGRSKLIADLITRLDRYNFLAVVGDSGSGKSSVVRAGLIPALKGIHLLEGYTNLLEGSVLWPIHVMTPTAHPLESLALSLTQHSNSTSETENMERALRQSDSTLHLAVRKLLHQNRVGRFLLVVDQFEELFTLCKDENERSAFINNLVTAVVPETAGPTTVLIVLRVDFLNHCFRYNELYDLIRTNEIKVAPMTMAELREAIEKPALSNGLDFEPNLVDRLLLDIGNAPGRLPLLSHALLETWERREGNLLTIKGYLESGGVQGAIAKTADKVYERYLNEEQQVISRYIFLRLIEPGENLPDTRRRASLEELVFGPAHDATVQEVLTTLVNHRLIITSSSNVELAHEALIEHWPTLKQWVDSNRESLITHHRLAAFVADWNKHEKHEDFLIIGKQLELFENWLSLNSGMANITEQTFTEASREKTLKLNKARLLIRRVAHLARGLVFLIFLTLLALTAFRLPPFTPTWQWMEGPRGGNPWNLLIDPTNPDHVYVGNSDQGIYKSLDGGYSWLPANTGLLGATVGRMIVDPNSATIYITDREKGVFMSDDGGENWIPINSGFPPSVLTTDLAFGANFSELYVTTWGQGIWHTSLPEVNWAQKTEVGLLSPAIYRIAITEDYPYTIFASSNHSGLFKSLDGGINWELVAFPEGDITILGIAPWDSQVIFVYDAKSGSYISHNSGLNWTPLTEELRGIPRSRPYFYTAGNQNAIYIGTLEGAIFRSDETGTSWETVWPNLPIGFIRDIKVLPGNDLGNRILVSTSNGVYTSNNYGESWDLTGPDILPVVTISRSPASMFEDQIFVGTWSGIHQTSIKPDWQTVNGGLWELEITRLLSSRQATHPLYALSNRGNLYKVVGGDNRWQTISLPAEASVVTASATVNDQEILHIATKENQIYQTLNPDEGWHYLWQAPSSVTAIVTEETSPATLYVATNNNGVYRSINGGEEWTPVNRGLTNPTVNDLIVADGINGVLYAATDDGVFASKNGGEFWNHSLQGLSNQRVIALAVHPGYPSMVYAATSGGIYISYNYGKSWRSLDRGLHTKDIMAVHTTDRHVYIGTRDGVYFMRHPLTLSLFGGEILPGD